jgi:hypothetical protein
MLKQVQNDRDGYCVSSERDYVKWESGADKTEEILKLLKVRRV